MIVTLVINNYRLILINNKLYLVILKYLLKYMDYLHQEVLK